MHSSPAFPVTMSFMDVQTVTMYQTVAICAGCNNAIAHALRCSGLHVGMIGVLSVQASAFTEANIVDVGSYEELKAAVAERKWARGPWAGHALPSHCFQTFKCIVRQVNMSAALAESL